MMSRHAQTPASAARHQARGVAQRRSRDRAYSERVVGQPQVIRFIRHAARWRRFFRCSLAASTFDPLGLNLLLMPGEHVLWRDVADGAVQTNVVVMLYVTLNQTPRIFERQRRPGPNALPFE